MPVDIPPERFRELVEEALDQIPESLVEFMHNVAITIDDLSPPRGLLGLYQGIPLTDRAWYGHAGAGGGGMVMPDKITIYRRAINAMCNSDDEVREQVRITVIHEVAHHFGIDDDRLDELGWA